MNRILQLFFVFTIAVAFVNCKANDGPTNEYKNAKVHESDRVAKDRKKMNRQAEKQARKNMKNARKAQRKKSRNWGKKGSYQ
ncbi:MAG: hypothetical protein L6Q81_08325 [Bacteroidia bacterium]|nr:hypothetical protein [Bacteroidia bacterium]